MYHCPSIHPSKPFLACRLKIRENRKRGFLFGWNSHSYTYLDRLVTIYTKPGSPRRISQKRILNFPNFSFLLFVIIDARWEKNPFYSWTICLHTPSWKVLTTLPENKRKLFTFLLEILINRTKRNSQIFERVNKVKCLNNGCDMLW